MLILPSFICGLALAAYANAQVTLGTAGQYGVFAASTITSTGLSTVDGKIGLSPGTSITGFPPGIATGGQDVNNNAATTAKTDIAAAYAALVALAVTTDLTGQNLGGLTLTSGVYGFSSSGSLTGTLTLDAQGDPNALFVFKFGSTLTTASNSNVVLINGAQACNVYWQVGSSATLGTGTAFIGNVIAQASITATTGVSLLGGGLYAMTAAVTLDTNMINPQGSCGGSVVTTSVSTTSPTSTISSTLSDSTTNSVPTTTVSVTTTSTNSASTTTITATASATITVTSTVAITTSTCTSTTTSISTKHSTTTCPAPKCTSTTSTSASDSKVSSTSSKASTASKRAAMEKRNNSTSTKTKTVTTTCAGHTSTHTAKSASVTSTRKTTHTATSTKWYTTTSTTTSTSTHTPSCTTSAKARRDYQRMFE